MRKAVAYSLAVMITLSLFVLPGLRGRATVRAQEAAPTLKRVMPDRISAGAPTFTLRLEGKNFAAGAKILFDGVPLASSRISKNGKVLLAEVDASAVASPGTHTAQAVNPAGMASATLTVTVVPTDPDLTIRLPENSAQEDSGLIFIPFVTGTGLSDVEKVFVWGKSTIFEIANDRRIQIQIPEGLVDDPARIPVMVRDKKGNYSNTEIFFIVPRPAKIDSFEPDTLEVGAADTLLKVFGNFNDEAFIVVNGVPLPTTIKKQHLEATIPASFLAQPAQLILRVDQSGIQSEDEIIPVTPTDAPFIFTIAPVLIRQGENRITIDIVGANFNGKSTALIDGQEAKVKDFTKRRLTVLVPKELLSVLGPHTVQVKDEDGNLTATAIFTVVPDVTVSTLAGQKREGFNQETCVSAEEALFRRPRRVSLAPDGLLYVTDQQNHAIRSINPDTGEVCTVAANGEEGY